MTMLSQNNSILRRIKERLLNFTKNTPENLNFEGIENTKFSFPIIYQFRDQKIRLNMTFS